MAERERIVKNIVENEITACEATKSFSVCVDYTALQDTANHKNEIEVQQAFAALKLLQQPADAFFGISNAHMSKVATSQEADKRVGNSYGSTMSVFEDAKRGLMVNVKSVNLSSYNNQICFLTKSTTTQEKPPAPKRSRRMKTKDIRSRRRLASVA